MGTGRFEQESEEESEATEKITKHDFSMSHISGTIDPISMIFSAIVLHAN